jgi:WD40 repeat protein
MNCKDETGALIHGKTLEDKVNEWLEKSVKDHPTLILLGDFGDGKTTFSYIFSRKLAEQFLKSPSTCWLPVRFSLRDFSIKNVNTSRDFLRRRLEEFGADIDSWDTLAKSKYKLLAILDGFDEMSKKMDHNTILEKIEQIIECYQNEFSGMKVLITSRKHFFENQQHKNQLLQRIKNPQLLMLAPIKRTETEGHLREYAKSIDEEAKFKIIMNRHDPIGLASKPLYLEMVKGSLKDLPDKDLDELILYETYIQQSLERKGYFLEDEKLETSPENIIENMKGILERVAIELHQSDEEFIYLSDIHGPQRLLRGLWKMSAPTDCTADDEIRRIAVRSLLKRVETGEDVEGKKFPVDFCHRSMREYFVARAVCKMVEQKLEQAKHFLRSCCLGYEIIFFANKMMKKNTGFDYTENLWQLILKTKYHKDKEKIKVGSLGSNAANLLYQYSGKIPKKDWSHLVLDWVDFSGADLSGKDFSHTSFHYANLDNVDFTNANFSHCDLTGVRLEEASPIQAVAVSQDESIYALYEDGVIREWIHNRVRSPYPVSLEKIETTNDIRLVAQPGNDLTLIDNNQLIFYDKDNEKIIQKARIDLKPVLKPINAFHDSLLIVEDKNNRYSLQLINLEQQSVIQSVSVKAFTLCAHLGSSAFIIYDEKDGLQIVNPLSGETKTISRIEPAKINCMATCQCEEFPDQWRLAIGREDGSITIFNIDLSTIEMEEVLKYKCHEKAVRDIAFIDENRVVSGGVDMKVLLTKIERDETARYISTEFKLNLQCKDMKVTGIKPDENRLFLEKIIAKTSGIELK